MITKNIYEMPYPVSAPEDMNSAKAYIDTLASWLANCLGLVVRSDLTVEAPDYGQYSYFKYLAPDAESDPYLAVYNANTSSSGRYVNSIISPVTKVGNYFRPVTVPSNPSSLTTNPMRYASNIVINPTGLGKNDYKNNLAVIDFNDGRKFGAFRGIRVSTGNMQGSDSFSSIYIGKIKMQGHDETACVVFAQYSSSSWLDDYEQCTNTTEMSIGNITVGIQANAGIIYSKTIGKDFLMGLDFCIGQDAFIPNMYHYSDSREQLVNGSIITINNKKYACFYRQGPSYARLLMPEYIDD